MDDFRRTPVNRVGQPQQNGEPVIAPAVAPVVAPVSTPDIPPAANSNTPLVPSPKKRGIWWAIAGGAGLLIALLGGMWVWYQVQLTPVDSRKEERTLLTVEPGSTPTMIADLLADKGVIRSSTAFLWYTRLQGVQHTLQAGAYRLSPSESTPQIVEHLSKGRVDTFSITFLPGGTLQDHKKSFLAAGYSESEVTAAFKKTYSSPLFEGKPAAADVEGYIYGETYTFGSDATVESILARTFEEFSTFVQKNDLVAAYKKQGLTLFEGLTLASIIQREASPSGTDMPQIAQVFYNRLANGMPLGSDVTYQYIADKTGVARDPNLDSPYNTRRVAGLPPGPIASPGKKALLAVAQPATGNYLYFLSGDDDVTYFGRTIEEHEANIKNHCQLKCQIL